ncbi:MAG: hypothetical protein AAGJ83_03135, partial [Planctomycetota bacterium]
MKFSLQLIGVVAICLTSTLGSSAVYGQATATDLPSAKDVFQKHLDALGDAKAIAAIKNQKMVGKISMPAMGLNGTMTIIQVRPNKISTVMELPQVGKQTQVFDGEIGWTDSAM